MTNPRDLSELRAADIRAAIRRRLRDSLAAEYRAGAGELADRVTLLWVAEYPEGDLRRIAERPATDYAAAAQRIIAAAQDSGLDRYTARLRRRPEWEIRADDRVRFAATQAADELRRPPATEQDDPRTALSRRLRNSFRTVLRDPRIADELARRVIIAWADYTDYELRLIATQSSGFPKLIRHIAARAAGFPGGVAGYANRIRRRTDDEIREEDEIHAAARRFAAELRGRTTTQTAQDGRVETELTKDK